MSGTLHMNMEEVFQLATNIGNTSLDIKQKFHTIQSSIVSINWNSPGQSVYVDSIQRAVSQVGLLAENVDSIKARLLNAVKNWELTANGQDVISCQTSDPSISSNQYSDGIMDFTDYFRSDRTVADLKKLLNTTLALKPLAVDMIIDKLDKHGLGLIKQIKNFHDVIELLQTKQRFEAVFQAQYNYDNSLAVYGSMSNEAKIAMQELEKASTELPVIGDYIKVALDMGKANPVY